MDVRIRLRRIKKVISLVTRPSDWAETSFRGNHRYPESNDDSENGSYDGPDVVDLGDTREWGCVEEGLEVV
jgi:hypothetical protein